MYKYIFTVLTVIIFGSCAFYGCTEPPIPAISPPSPSFSNAGAAGGVRQPEKAVEFLSDYDSARETAKKENKPLLLFFYTPKCVYSRQMLNETFRNKEVLDFAKQFICLQIDESRSRELCEELDVNATPTIQFMTPDGTLLQRLTAKKTADQLLLQMHVAIQSLATSEKMRNRN